MVGLGQGIATLALESPFYGRRRPVYQSGSKLHRVSDLLALGRATIEESLSLLNWAQVNGFNRLGDAPRPAVSFLKLADASVCKLHPSTPK